MVPYRHGSTILLQYSVRVGSGLLHSPIRETTKGFAPTLYMIHSFHCARCVALRFCRLNVIIRLYLISPAVFIYLWLYLISPAVLIYLRLYLYISGCIYISPAVLICTYISPAVFIYLLVVLTYIWLCLYISCTYISLAVYIHSLILRQF